MRFVRRSAPPPPTLAEEESGPQTHFLGKDLVASPQDHTMVRTEALTRDRQRDPQLPIRTTRSSRMPRLCAFAHVERMMDSGMGSRCRG
jgi:hypothetical protein